LRLRAARLEKHHSERCDQTDRDEWTALLPILPGHFSLSWSPHGRLRDADVVRGAPGGRKIPENLAARPPCDRFVAFCYETDTPAVFRDAPPSRASRQQGRWQALCVVFCTKYRRICLPRREQQSRDEKGCTRATCMFATVLTPQSRVSVT
jgi:hypothetical protein